MSSHVSLASPSSLWRSSSTSLLCFFLEAGAALSWAPRSGAARHARQCRAWTLLMSVHAGQDHSPLLVGKTSAGREGEGEGESGDGSSFRMLRRLLARCSGGADGCEKTRAVGEGPGLVTCLMQTSAGGTSRRLQGSGLFCLEELGAGQEASPSKDPPPPAEADRDRPACWTPGSGTSRASAGIWGRDSLRGPPQAEQDMEVGVFWSVHLKQSHARLSRSASSRRFCSCRLQGSVADGLRGPEPPLELRRRSPGVPAYPQSGQVARSAELARVQRGHDQPLSSPLGRRHNHWASDRRRGASQTEQRGAPAALRKVQQPQAHWVLRRGIEPEEKLQETGNKVQQRVPVPTRQL